MKNKKSIMAFICIMCGILLAIFCLATQRYPFYSSSSGQGYIISKSIDLSVLIYISFFFMILSGLMSIFTRHKALRIILYFFTFAFTLLALITLKIVLIIPASIIALIALIIEIIAQEPNKSLHIVKNGKKLNLVFLSDYKKIKKEKGETKVHKSKSKTHSASKKKKRVPHAGKMIKSPNGKNFKYKKKRK